MEAAAPFHQAVQVLPPDLRRGALELPEEISASFLGAAVLELTNRDGQDPWFQFLNRLRREAPVIHRETCLLPDGTLAEAMPEELAGQLPQEEGITDNLTGVPEETVPETRVYETEEYMDPLPEGEEGIPDHPPDGTGENGEFMPEETSPASAEESRESETAEKSG